MLMMHDAMMMQKEKKEILFGEKPRDVTAGLLSISDSFTVDAVESSHTPNSDEYLWTLASPKARLVDIQTI